MFKFVLKTFLSTLGITENSVRNWMENSEKGITKKIQNRHRPPKERAKEDVAFLKAYFNDLSKMPSYYCQTLSTILYSEQDIQHKSKLYYVK